MKTAVKLLKCPLKKIKNNLQGSLVLMMCGIFFESNTIDRVKTLK